MTATTTNEMSWLPPTEKYPVDDPCEDGQDGERNGIFVFQNQPVHLIALS